MKNKIKTFFIYVVYLVKMIEGGKFFQIDNQTYYVSYPSKENWYIAMKSCAYIGMNLVDVLHKNEEDRILTIIDRTEFVNDTRAAYWTSGTDLGGEGTFYWATSGHSLVYTNWFAGQPDNYKSNITNKMESQNCVWIASVRNVFRWDDNYCSTKSYYICRDTSVYKPPLQFSNILSLNNSVKIINKIKR